MAYAVDVENIQGKGAGKVVGIDIYRDLHCWEMTFNWIPLGFHQSYNFVIRVKSSILQDLKLTKKRDFYDY